MKSLKLIIAVSILAITACTKPPIDSPKEEEKGCAIKGKFETAMCGWGVYDSYWIRLEDGTFLQPCKSDIPLIDKDKIYNGREVEVGYRDISYTEKGQCNSNVACLAYPGEHINVSLTCLTLLGEDKPKEEDPKCEYKDEGVLYNWSGKLDGCGWVIKHTNGDILEVWEDDIIRTGLTDGTTVVFDFGPARRASFCMAGRPIQIWCIKEKPKKETPKCKYENEGLLYNSGCSWMIKTNNNEVIEVVDTDIEATGLTDGTTVLFDYSASRRATTCMAGIPAIIWCIKAKPNTPKCKYENQGVLVNNGTCWMIEDNEGGKYELIDSDDEIKGIDSGTPVLFSYSAMRMKGNCMPSIPAKIWCIKVANTTF